MQLSEIVSLFQDRCAQAIWAHDGIVNKQMGDGLMAIFNFPIVRKDHAGAAILAAQEIQRNCATALNGLTLEALPGRTLGVGVGIHSGEVQIGEFSSFRSDFTAIGGVVNQAARLESQAAAGEIPISAETAAKAADLPQAPKPACLCSRASSSRCRHEFWSSPELPTAPPTPPSVYTVLNVAAAVSRVVIAERVKLHAN